MKAKCFVTYFEIVLRERDTTKVVRIIVAIWDNDRFSSTKFLMASLISAVIFMLCR